MIDLYTWPTPNGHKIHIMLEETGLEYRVHPIDIGAGEQFKPEFLAISPNNKIPAMVDQQGPDGKPFALAESVLALARLIGEFRVELVDTGPIIPVGVVTTQPDHSPMFRITPR